MDPITGIKIVEINGQKYAMRFTWRALSEIEAAYGDNPNLFDPQIVATVAAAGLRDRHPEMTADKIIDLSPPLIPFAKSVQTAIQWAYFGKEPVPKDDSVKKNPRADGLWSRIVTRFQSAFRPLSSGA